MRRLALGAAVPMLVTLTLALGGVQAVAQSDVRNMLSETQGTAGVPQLVQQGVQSNHAMFGHLCGIANLDPQSAIRLWRSADGEWNVVAAGQHPGPGANAAARVWHEHNWMVDIHDSPGHTMHTGEMCFAASGEILLLTDDYMDVEGCACVRYTAQSFDERGKVKAHMQRFVSTKTGAEIDEPAAARDFPAIFEFRHVEQLPFYSLVSAGAPTAGAPKK